MKIAQAIIWDS